jgi:hypothetical protein
MSNKTIKSGTGFSGKSTSLLLIIILLFNVFGYNVYFNVLQNSIRREISFRIKSGIQESELIIIELTTQIEQEITWIKPEKEFTHGGNLYDVVRVTHNNGKTFFHCINDTKENRLIREYAKNANSSQKARKIMNSINLIYFCDQGSDLYLRETSNHEYYTKAFHLTSKNREISDPPPKAIL